MIYYIRRFVGSTDIRDIGPAEQGTCGELAARAAPASVDDIDLDI